jgi:hypothetical protein
MKKCLICGSKIDNPSQINIQICSNKRCRLLLNYSYFKDGKLNVPTTHQILSKRKTRKNKLARIHNVDLVSKKRSQMVRN